MSDYVIHNIGLIVSPQLDFNQLVEAMKSVAECPNYYLGKKQLSSMLLNYSQYLCNSIR